MRFACVLGAALLLAGSAWAAKITRTASTPSYKLSLTVGPREAMYTAAQVKAKHPMSGEVMVGSSMSMGEDSMRMSGTTRHLEVHVRSRTTGKPVTNVMPAITLTDMQGMAMSSKLEVMAMKGIGEGISDLHYGNNVQLTAGHRYTVSVVVKGERASFTFRAS